MANRIFNIIGWIGTALVVGAVALKYGVQGKEQYAFYLAWAGLVCMLLYILSQWREIAGMFTKREAKNQRKLGSRSGATESVHFTLVT